VKILKEKKSKQNRQSLILFCLIILLFSTQIHASDSLTIPAKKWGICFGNSTTFAGLRFNVVDKNIEIINGINVTLWKPKDEFAGGTVNGLSLGLAPFAAKLNGIQIGIVGVGAKENVNGISIGLLGVGSGGDMKGINIGGIGIGAGGNLIGLNVGLIGAGAGGNVIGINIGGLGIGAGKSLTGFNFGLFGVGAGEHVRGINIGGLGVGAGDTLAGLTLAGIGAGASKVKGIALAGGGIGGESITGIAIAIGTIHIANNGTFTGLAISAFNNIKGTQKGVAIGIVNYAYRLKGIQIGLINIVRDNPKGRKALPIININF